MDNMLRIWKSVSQDLFLGLLLKLPIFVKEKAAAQKIKKFIDAIKCKLALL